MNKDLSDALIWIDTSALQGMFEGKEDDKSKALTKLIKKLKDNGQKLNVVTTQSAFLRALFLSNSETKIKEVQKVLSFINIAPSFSDFKKEKEFWKKRFANVMNGNKNDNSKTKTNT